MDNISEDTWEIAAACRKACNQKFYGGGAPNDSNALSEVAPSSVLGVPAGALFSLELHGVSYEVVVVPVAKTGRYFPSVDDARAALGLRG